MTIREIILQTSTLSSGTIREHFASMETGVATYSAPQATRSKPVCAVKEADAISLDFMDSKMAVKRAALSNRFNK